MLSFHLQVAVLAAMLVPRAATASVAIIDVSVASGFVYHSCDAERDKQLRESFHVDREDLMTCIKKEEEA